MWNSLIQSTAGFIKQHSVGAAVIVFLSSVLSSGIIATITANATKDAAQIENQPALFDYASREIQRMNQQYRNDIETLRTQIKAYEIKLRLQAAEIEELKAIVRKTQLECVPMRILPPELKREIEPYYYKSHQDYPSMNKLDQEISNIEDELDLYMDENFNDPELDSLKDIQ